MFNRPVDTDLSSPVAAATLMPSSARPELGIEDETARLRREVARHHAVEQELMQLLGTTRPDRIIHDVRNLLQERIFLLAACKDIEERQLDDR